MKKLNILKHKELKSTSKVLYYIYDQNNHTYYNGEIDIQVQL